MIELPRLHSGLRHLQSRHNVLNESTGLPSSATSRFSVHNAATSRRRRLTIISSLQTSINHHHRFPTLVDVTIEPLTPSSTFCITSSTLLKHHPRRRAAAASRRFCIIRKKATNSRRQLQLQTTYPRRHEILPPSRQRQHPRRDSAASRQRSRIPQPSGRRQNSYSRRVSCIFTILLDSIQLNNLLSSLQQIHSSNLSHKYVLKQVHSSN